MGIRHGFGLFLQPMTTDLGWGRESFWLGGFAYDRTGSYDVVWLIAIALGVVAALVNLPIDDREIPRAPRPLTA